MQDIHLLNSLRQSNKNRGEKWARIMKSVSGNDITKTTTDEGEDDEDDDDDGTMMTTTTTMPSNQSISLVTAPKHANVPS